MKAATAKLVDVLAALVREHVAAKLADVQRALVKRADSLAARIEQFEASLVKSEDWSAALCGTPSTLRDWKIAGNQKDARE